MAAISVKNIPVKLYNEIKLMARVHHRSINSEIIACLERELLIAHVSPEERIRRARELRKMVDVRVISAREIAQVIKEGRP